MGKGIYKHVNGNNSDNRKSNIVPVRGLKNDGKIRMNGYIAVYMPEHPRAFDNGCVYEHLLVAEDILGRYLNPEECVHHKDFDRTNNSKENLMIFATIKDHALFHGGANIHMRDDGIYICDEIKIKYKYINVNNSGISDNHFIEEVIILKPGHNICPICKINQKSIKAKMCQECYRKIQQKNIPTKEELEKYIYDIPFVKIAEIYNVTDNAVRKWCKKYNLPYRKKDMKLRLTS